MARMSLELSFGSRNAKTSAISVDWLLPANGASPWSAACRRGAADRQSTCVSIKAPSAFRELPKNSFLITSTSLCKKTLPCHSKRFSYFIQQYEDLFAQILL